MSAKTSFPKDKIEILLLEGVHPQGIGRLKEEGFAIRTEKRAFSEADLEAAIETLHVLGVRSKTQLTEKTIAKSRRLLAVGAFCIGTNQIDLDAAHGHGEGHSKHRPAAGCDGGIHQDADLVLARVFMDGLDGTSDMKKRRGLSSRRSLRDNSVPSTLRGATSCC
ncbi:MAG: hypothetical protein JRS35_17530 [Deltaproteobacteria bacterium]|nr:hypothetical protein [Deltaproteobacteria bacterium]